MQLLQTDTFTQFRFLSSVRLSPDGQKAAFIVKDANLKENTYNSNIWLYLLEQNKLLQLTTSGQDIAFAWLDDSQHLLFFSKRQESEEKETPVFMIAIHGGEAKKAFSIPMRAESLRPVDITVEPLCGRLLFSARIDLEEKPASKDESREDHEKRQEQEKEALDYHVLDQVPYWANGEGHINKKRTHLCLYDVESGQARDLTPGLFQMEKFDHRGEQVILTGYEFEDLAPLVNDLYRLDLLDGAMKKLTAGTHTFGQPRFLTDELVIAPATDMKRYGINQNRELHTFHLVENRLENLTPNWDKSLNCSVGSDCRLGASEANQADQGRFYFGTTEGDSCYLNVITEQGRVDRVVAGQGAVDSFDVKGDTVIYVAFRESKLQELYLLAEGQEMQVSAFNQALLQDFALSNPEHFTVPSAEGVELDAWIMRPVDFEENKRYPAILEIHGGPKTVSSQIFFHEYQVLASQGYAVFFCNPRGSDGKGDAFADIRGKYGTIDYQDIMAVVDHVIEHYDFVDPDRLGVTGGSYGGYMTNWIIGHTDRFKAAVSQRSIANWVTFNLTTDIGYYFGPDQVGATPWENMDKVWFHSPLRVADQVKTPTLFIHSAEDYRCWLSEGLQMFTALRILGLEARLVIFEGENHELSRGGKPKHRIRRLEEILNWFERHLRPA